MNQLIRLIEVYWLLITVAIMIPIAVLSLYPLDSLPPVPGTDKTHHFIAYAALAFPVAFSKPKSWLFVIASFLVFSGAIELIQPYVNRYGEWLDMASNGFGLIIGIALATAAKAILKSKY